MFPLSVPQQELPNCPDDHHLRDLPRLVGFQLSPSKTHPVHLISVICSNWGSRLSRKCSFRAIAVWFSCVLMLFRSIFTSHYMNVCLCVPHMKKNMRFIVNDKKSQDAIKFSPTWNRWGWGRGSCCYVFIWFIFFHNHMHFVFFHFYLQVRGTWKLFLSKASSHPFTFTATANISNRNIPPQVFRAPSGLYHLIISAWDWSLQLVNHKLNSISDFNLIGLD